jgi:beta-galactosidase
MLKVNTNSTDQEDKMMNDKNEMIRGSVRARLLLDPGWRFYLGEPPMPEQGDTKLDHFPNAGTHVSGGAAHPDYDDSTWQKVDLPHDWAVEGSFDPQANPYHGFLPVGVGWYRKTFELPEADKACRFYLEFDGAFRESSVWVNGYWMGCQPSGYVSFRYDISDVLNYGGKNVVAVRLDATGYEGWWYEGAGLYRHAWLLKVSPVHVNPWGVFVQPQAKQDLQQWQVKIDTELVNYSEAEALVTVESILLDRLGAEVALTRSEQSLSAGAQVTTRQEVQVNSPLLWSIETPVLYRLVTRVWMGKALSDACETAFGFRTLRFDADQGFFLNEQPLKLKGTCNHQDHAGVGVAIPDRLFEYRVRRLQEMGSNAYRCAHNPPAPELLDACDRLGMLVLDETRHLNSNPEGLAQLESLIRRDRNHPCVMMWSLGNEEPIQRTDAGARMIRTMKRLARRLDPTRLVTLAMNGGWGSATSDVLDVQGFNYNIKEYDAFHDKFPRKPLFVSESGSTVGTRGIYARDPEHGYVSAYDHNELTWTAAAEDTWKAAAERAFIAGTFVWTGFDYRGEPTPYLWPCVNSHFGILDTCGFPKDHFYYYQSWWSSRVVLHLQPHWNWAGREGEAVLVRALSNCEQVELFLNGKSLGLKTVPRNSFAEWQVPYEPGVLAARGFVAGKEAAYQERKTTGMPAQVCLQADRDVLAADGEDLAVVNVSILDQDGLVVPDARNLVRFSLEGEGKILGVGNGDPSCHEPDKASQRSAFGGSCQVIVQVTTQPGEIVLSAQSAGLKPARLVMKADSAPVRPRI